MGMRCGFWAVGRESLAGWRIVLVRFFVIIIIVTVVVSWIWW